ncbi:hypothetical protein HDA40_006305 [Hamadaea flava]|uniref:DUF4190 domain-containing protein n=1 Tax=Hamadaea flava TaxID=1742688 RepID=UPI0020A238CF|nr:DUF4190 domain-containing protein [Hamadaea flava]MCP2327798.1 hypothetical protein [Hamadaea flava]
MTYPPQPQNPQNPPPYGQPPQPYGAPQPQPQYEQPQYGQPQYGQPQYGQPQYGQPQYGQPQPQYGQPQYGAPGQQFPPPGSQWEPQTPPPSGTNGFAVASLIFGILGGILFAVIFGFVALSQIKKRNQKGRGMAIAGLVLSVVWLLACGAGVAISALNQPDRDADGTVTEEGTVSSVELKLGDCLKKLPAEGVVKAVDVVPCSQAHGAEVYAVFNLSGSTYPGSDTVIKQSEDGCTERVDALSAEAQKDDTLEVYYLYPHTSLVWNSGDHSVSCLVGSETKQYTGSLRK